MSLRAFFLPSILGVLAALAPAAHARGWGFDRDTVYEWGDTATGRTRLVNGGVSALALDSAFAEGTGKPWGELSFTLDGTSNKIFRPASPIAALPVAIPAGGLAWLRTFDVIPSTCMLKVAADSVPTADTLSVRLRVRSKAGEEDTLIVTGTSCGRLSVGVRAPFAPGRPGASYAPAPATARDALGRDRLPAKAYPTTLRR